MVLDRNDDCSSYSYFLVLGLYAYAFVYISKQYRISIAPLDFPATVLYKYAVVD